MGEFGHHVEGSWGWSNVGKREAWDALSIDPRLDRPGVRRPDVGEWWEPEWMAWLAAVGDGSHRRGHHPTRVVSSGPAKSLLVQPQGSKTCHTLASQEPSTPNQDMPRTGIQDMPRTGVLTVIEPLLIDSSATTTTGGHPNMSSTDTITSEVVTSPAGERIEVLSDGEWAKLTDTTIRAVERPYSTKIAALTALWDMGTISDENGQAIGRWMTTARGYGYTGRTLAGLTTMCNESVNAAAIHRTINGRRTMDITLVALPKTWHRKVLELSERRGKARPAPTPPPAPSTPQTAAQREPAPSEIPAPTTTPSDALPADSITAVAVALLARVVEVINQGDHTAEVQALTTQLAAIQTRLADNLEYTERLRTKYRDQGELLAATIKERDGLRQRLRMADNNVAAMMNGPTRNVVGEAIGRELSKIMATPPQGSKGSDEDA